MSITLFFSLSFFFTWKEGGVMIRQARKTQYKKREIQELLVPFQKVECAVSWQQFREYYIFAPFSPLFFFFLPLIIYSGKHTKRYMYILYVYIRRRGGGRTRDKENELRLGSYWLVAVPSTPTDSSLRARTRISRSYRSYFPNLIKLYSWWDCRKRPKTPKRNFRIHSNILRVLVEQQKPVANRRISPPFM